MTRILLTALVAFVILAACTKVDNPTIYYRPDYPKPDSTKIDSTKIDTAIVPVPLPTSLIPVGQVDAPYLVIMFRNWPQCNYFLEKYRLDGTAKNFYVDGIYDPEAPYGFPDLSPRGDKMVYVHRDSIIMLELSTMNKTLITVIQKGLGLLTLSRDASKIVFSTWGNEWLEDFYYVDAVEDARPIKVKNVSLGDVYVASISPDGKKIAYDVNGFVYVSDIDGENRIRISEVDGNKSPDFFPIFNREGDKVIFSSGQYIGSVSDLFIAPIEENGERNAFRILNYSEAGINPAYEYVLSGDGQSIFVAATTQDGYNIYKVPVAGGSPVSVISGIGNSKWEISGMHFVEQ